MPEHRGHHQRPLSTNITTASWWPLRTSTEPTARRPCTRLELTAWSRSLSNLSLTTLTCHEPTAEIPHHPVQGVKKEVLCHRPHQGTQQVVSEPISSGSAARKQGMGWRQLGFAIAPSCLRVGNARLENTASTLCCRL
jgi:hypothetical protein